MCFAPEPIETTRRSHRVAHSNPENNMSPKRTLEFLPEPIKTSTRSVRQKSSSPDSSNSHANSSQFLPIPVETSRRSHRETHSTPLTSQSLASLLASLPQPVSTIKRSNRVSPRSLYESSACPSLSTSPGSTSSRSSISMQNAEEDVEIRDVNSGLSLGVDENDNSLKGDKVGTVGNLGSEREDSDVDGMDTPVKQESASRFLPMGGRAASIDDIDPHSNNNARGENPSLNPTNKNAVVTLRDKISVRGRVQPSEVVAVDVDGAPETQITSRNSSQLSPAPPPENPAVRVPVFTPSKPKSILIPHGSVAFVESPLQTTLVHEKTKSPDYFCSSGNNTKTSSRSPSPCLWNSNDDNNTHSQLHSLWTSNSHKQNKLNNQNNTDNNCNASRCFNYKPSSDPTVQNRSDKNNTKMSTSSESSTSSTSTALTVPPTTPDEKDQKELSIAKVSLWRPDSPPSRAKSPCLWTKPGTTYSPNSSISEESTSSSNTGCTSVSLYQATETLTDEELECQKKAVLCPCTPGEVSEEFVQQVYRYLSFKHECMARDYDEEISEVTGICVEDVRADRFMALKRYVEDYIGRVPGIRTGQGW